MFVRRKKNRSGSTSVVVVNKSAGRFREIRTIGVSSEADEVENLCKLGKEWIDRYGGQMDLFSSSGKEQASEAEEMITRQVLDNFDNILLNSARLILDRVYSSIGFDKINDVILKQLVTARLNQPLIKLATVDYLKSYFDEDVNLSKIYRYLDKLYNRQREKIQQIRIEHTRKVLGGSIGLVF